MAVKLKCANCGKEYFTDGEPHKCKRRVKKSHFNPNQPRNPHTGEWIKVGSALASAIEDWESNNNFKIIREHMRGTRKDSRVIGLKRAFDTHFKKSSHTLQSDTTLYRGLWGDHAVEVKSLKKGDTYSDANYLAVTDTLKATDAYAKRRSRTKNVVIAFETPKGTQIIDVSAHHQSLGRIFHGKIPEIILDRGIEWVVVSNKNGIVTMRPRKISKANPLWDGDGVQGAGQPRDRRGRWIHFPGPTSIVRAIIRQVGSRHQLITEDRDRNEKVHSTHRSAKSANTAMAKLLREDADKYVENQQASARLRRTKDVAQGRREHLAQQERTREGNARQIASTQRAVDLPSEGRGQRKPAVRARRVEESTTERLPNPGRPTQAQANAATVHARREMPENEAKYASLVVRLLKNKGVTQDPARRGDINDKYDISPKRQVEIEREMYDHMFPQKSPTARRVNFAGGADITTQQINEMRRLGARKGTPEPDPVNASKPSRYFKIMKGRDRGRWAKVSWNGHTELVTKKEATRAISRSKVEWTKRLLSRANYRANKARQYRVAQAALRDTNLENREALRDFKIAQAQRWADGEGLDPDDSYWWAFFWNDPSLLREQKGDTSSPMIVNLAPEMRQQHMDPSILEGILSMPDIDSRKMRGHRPDSPKSRRGDEDFEEASPEARQVSGEHESANRERLIRHERRIQNAYDRYKKAHPGTKLSLAEFTDNYYNNKLRIPGGSRRDIRKADNWWIHEPRDFHGRWTKIGAIGRLLGDADLGSRAHHGSTPRRRALKDRGAPKDAFNMRGRTIANGLKISRPQKGSSHQAKLGDGTPVKRRRHFTPETAYFLRNNGRTRISDERLRDIYEDRSQATPEEFDLLLSAAGDARFDGSQMIPFRSVREGGAQRKMERFKMIKNLRTQLTQDFAKEKGKGSKGAGGQQLIHGARDKRAKAQRQKDNTKRAENQRNFVNRATRQQLIDDFGDGKKAKCIFCGGSVTVDRVSPERMKPGPLGGKYEKGNMAPAHVTCNERAGTQAQYHPAEYYQDMMKKFLKIYQPEIRNGKLNFVFGKHRKHLGGKRP